MTLIEKIEVMDWFKSGKEIQSQPKRREKYGWFDNSDPSWNWELNNYRKKPKPVELLYEYWHGSSNTKRIFTNNVLYTEDHAKINFINTEYGKTGRWFNPETKEFGHD